MFGADHHQALRWHRGAGLAFRQVAREQPEHPRDNQAAGDAVQAPRLVAPQRRVRPEDPQTQGHQAADRHHEAS